MRLPPLNSLRAFEAVARRGSLVTAAAELNVTHGALSKQIRLLEEELGHPLFERRNRGLHLTTRGAWLAERLGPLFGGLAQTMDAFRHLDAGPPPLVVSCEPTLCLRFLIPAMVDLEQETGMAVRALAAGGPVDFASRNYDLALRRHDFPLADGIEAIPLVEERMGPVVAPSLADADLSTVNRLHSRTRPGAWKEWLRNRKVRFEGPDIQYEHFYLTLQAALAGQGVAMASVHMVSKALEQGRLVAPHGFAPDGTAYVLLRPSGRPDDPRVDRLVEWLRARMRLHLNF
ncbi:MULTISPECIES: LysR substrate-binding domain-containing protein [unclassified Brevundimonas]|uniref:LysR substrate-binding domain-containing protein n=1 Tax=unclassified Brevundimonas TaxID=2622653 RepID=UPI0025BF24A1|nr:MULTISPECIES: LysR substrate-binding domain-containing protein [unclassified Brevundimonas]